MIGEKVERSQPEFKNFIACVAWLFVIFCFYWVDDVNAQIGLKDVPNIGESGNTQPGSPSWSPSSAHPDKFDWIQLTSGEWLKGEFKVLYDRKLEFDSDELDLLELDWEDVKQVRGYKPQSIRFEGPITVVGVLTIVDDKASVLTEDGMLEFDLSNLISIAPAETNRISSWSAKISISLDVRKGNSEQTNYNTSVSVERRTSKSRYYIDYLGIINNSEGVETANSQRVNSHFDIFKTRRFYWRPVFGEYFRDPFSNIESRVNVGMGVGYHFIDTPKTTFDITPGLAYQYTQNVSVEVGQSSFSSTPALEVAMDYETELTKKIDCKVNYKLNVVNRESGKYLHHAVTSLEIELTRRLDLDLSVVWDRIQDPKLQDDGLIPEQDDFHFLFGIGFEL